MSKRGFVLWVGLVTAVLVGAPGIRAQTAADVPLIGFLGTSPERVQGVFVAPLRAGLRDAGLVEGRDYRLAVRFGDADRARVAKLAAEMVRRKVAVIVGFGGAAVQEAAKATKTIPIVAGFSANLIAMGLVASLGKPGGNVTGINTFATELSAKRLELLAQVVPRARRIGVVFDPVGPLTAATLRHTKTAAARLGLAIVEAPVRGPDDFAAAFAAIAAARAEAVIPFVGRVTGGHRRKLIALAIEHRLPAVCWRAGLARLGCLVSYGANRAAMVRRAASHVARILRGAKPADLPVERPTEFDLAVNLRTAKAIGIAIPRSILLRATEVIE